MARQLCDTCKHLANIGFPTRDCDGLKCRHCPWPGCNCTHSAGCDRGWIDADPLSDMGYPAVTRCPVCRSAGQDAALLMSAGK